MDPTTRKDFNPGVRRLVTWLRSHGFRTTDSGDGQTHVHGCDRDHPYVVMTCKPEHLYRETKRLGDLMTRAGIQIQPLDPEGVAPNLQSTWDVCLDVAWMDLINVTDAMLPDILPATNGGEQ